MVCVFPPRAANDILTRTGPASPRTPASLQLPDAHRGLSLCLLGWTHSVPCWQIQPHSHSWAFREPHRYPGPGRTTVSFSGLILTAHRVNSTCLQFCLAGSVFKCECGSCTHSPGFRFYPPCCLNPPPRNSHISCNCLEPARI